MTRILKVALVVMLWMALASPMHAQDVQLELWSFLDPRGDDVRSEALRHVIETFEEQHPGIRVVTNVIQWTELSPTLLRASMARRVPDVVMVYSPLLLAQIAAGTVTPLDGYMADWSSEDRSDLIVPAEAVGADGQVYGLPYELRVSGII